MIPKIIHYCWFGGNPIPDGIISYMQTWKEIMPDWKIIEWNESNFDIRQSPRYVQEAYHARKFAFVSDYVRLWALEQYGGVYFDTDVEVLKPFDYLINNKAFIGLEEEHGFVPCRDEQYISHYGLRVYTHDYFSPITSTRVMRKTKNTYCIHHFAGSWTNTKKRYKIQNTLIYREFINALIQIKRWLKGIK